MINSILRKLASSRWTKVRTAWPLEENAKIPKINPQIQSPLFTMLSAELRILIYETILSDPVRFLHIYEFNDGSGVHKLYESEPMVMAHKRCSEPLELPTWQDSCTPSLRFDGERLNGTSSSDGFMQLLLTCRRVYSEALPILYNSNTFHFRGAQLLLTLNNKLPAPHFQALRHIHISTIFREDRVREGYLGEQSTLAQPRNRALQNWEACCNILKGLSGLRSFRLDAIVFNGEWHIGETYEPTDDFLVSVFTPLVGVRASVCEVEMYMKLPVAVLSALGDTTITFVVKEKPPNFPLYWT